MSTLRASFLGTICRRISKWCKSGPWKRSLALGEHLQIMKNLQSHYDDFLEDSCDSQFFSVADRLRLEEEVDSCKEHYRQLLDSIKNEDKDESLARTYISELRNVRLQLEECEAKLARRIQFLDSTGSDVIERNTVCLTEQEKMQEELKKVKLDLTQISDRCNHFLLKFAPGPSVSNLRSELQLLVQKMDNMYGLSSLYLDKLKTVDVLVRGIQEAEALVKGYEVKLCQEDVVPFNLTAIYSQSALLQQWLCQVKEKNALFLTLDEDVSRATGAGEPSQEHNANLQRCKEKASQLQERWQRIQSQAETRHGDLEDIHGLLKHYRECHTELITWIEQTSLEQEMMKPGQAEDSRELSAQLSQQTALVAEIEKNQAKLDECQKFSQNYSSSVKDYELQLMTYRAFVDSQEKSPIKRRRMLSSSDAITQEFMNLRTRYTALVTLTTQHVKYISDALWRLEEEEKVVEEEKQEHVEKVKKLLGWALGLAGDLPPLTKERQDLKDCISEQQALGEELGVMKEQVSDAIRTAQIFLAKHGHKLSAEEREQIRQEVDLLEDTYRQLCSGSEKQLQQLQNQLAKETEQKGTEIIAGILDLGTMEIFPIFRAMQNGLMDQDTGLVLLEAQLATSGLILPETKEMLCLEEALARNFIDHRTFQLLQSLQHALQLIDQTNFENKQLLPVVAAIEEKKINEDLGLKILEANFAMGGFSGLEEAFEEGLITVHLRSKLEYHRQSLKLIDPNTAERINLSDLMQKCITHQETGLRLLPVKQRTGDLVCLRSGRKVSIFRAFREGLIDRQVTVRLLESQLVAGGIVDHRTGHRLTLDKAVKQNLIDQDLACAIFKRQLRAGGIVDPVTGQRLALDEAVTKDLISSRIAVVILESLQSFVGLLWPESGEILTLTDALQEDILSTELAYEIVRNRHSFKGLYIPETLEVWSYKKAVQQGILTTDVAKKLESTFIPDVVLCTKRVDSPSRSILALASTASQPPQEKHKTQEVQSEDDAEILFHLMTQSYINIHNGHRLLLVDRKLLHVSQSFFETYGCESNESNAGDDNNQIGQKILKETNNKESSMVLRAVVDERLDPYQFFYTPLTKDNEEAVSEASLLDLRTPPLRKEKAEKIQETKNTGIEIYKTEPFQDQNDTEPVLQQRVVSLNENEEEISSFKDESNSFPSGVNVEVKVLEAQLALADGECSVEYSTNEDWSLRASHGEAERKEMEEEQIVSESMMKDVVKPKDNMIAKQKKNRNSPESVVQSDDFKRVSSRNNDRLEERSMQLSETLLGKNREPEEIKNGRTGPLELHELKLEMLEEENTLKMLLAQLQDGGIISDRTDRKMLLNEAVSCGVVPSHTAVKLLGKLSMFSGFFDPHTCESLSIEEAIDEGLMDEKLMQKVLSPEKAICGVINLYNNMIYSVKEAADVGLLDNETVMRILEGQVVTGGIIDLKRSKRISVTLASNLGLVDKCGQENLKKLERACKGKDTEIETRQKLISLQMEISGIINPKTKEPLTVVQAIQKGFLSKEEAILLLSEQIANGGIIHHLSGMRLSVTDALQYGLINQDLSQELLEVERVCRQQHLHLDLEELVSAPLVVSSGLKVQGLQTLSGSIIDSASGKEIALSQAVREDLQSETTANLTSEMKQRIVDPENCIIVSYSEFLKKCKIDIESGQRYLAITPLKELKEKPSGNVLTVAQAIEFGKVDPIPALRLLQAQADAGGIIDAANGERLSLMLALKKGLVDEETVRIIAANQIWTGGIYDPSSGIRISLPDAIKKDLISQNVAAFLEADVRDSSYCTNVERDLTKDVLQNGASITKELITFLAADHSGEYKITDNVTCGSKEEREKKHKEMEKAVGTEVFKDMPAEKVSEAKELPQQTVKPPSENASETKELPQQTVKPPSEKASEAKELPQQTVKPPSEKTSKAKELPQQTQKLPSEKASETKELPQQTVKPPSEKASEAKELPQQTQKLPSEKASETKELPQQSQKPPAEKAWEAKELPQQIVKPLSEKALEAKELPQQTVKPPSEKASKAKELPQQSQKLPSEKASETKELPQQTVKPPSEKASEAKELPQQTVKPPSEKASEAKELPQQSQKLPSEKASETKELPQQTVKPPSEKASEAKKLPQQTVKTPAEKASEAKELPQQTVKTPAEKASEAKELPQQTVKPPAEKASEAKELPQQTVKPPSEKASEAKELPQQTQKLPSEKASETKELPQQTVKPPSEKALKAKELPQQTQKLPSEKASETKELPQQTVKPPSEKALEAKELPQQTVKPPSEKASEAKELPQQTVKPPSEKASEAKELPQQTQKLPSEKASETKELPQQTVKPSSEKASEAKELPQQTQKLPSEKASETKELPQQTVKLPSEKASEAKELPQQTQKLPSEKASETKELPQQTVKLSSEKVSEAKELPQQTQKLPSEKASETKELPQQTVKLPSEKASEAKELPQQSQKPPAEKAWEAKELPQQTVKPLSEKALEAKELPQQTVKPPSEKALKAKELPQQTQKLPSEKASETKELPQQTVKPPSEKASEAKELTQQTVKTPAEKASKAKELPQQTVKPPAEKALEAKELPQQTVKPPAEKTLEAKELSQETVKPPSEKASEAKELPQQTVKPPVEKPLEAKELPQQTVKPPVEKPLETKELPQQTMKELHQQTVKPPSEKALAAKELSQETVKPPAEKTLEAKELPQQTVKELHQQTVKPPSEKASKAKELPQQTVKLPAEKALVAKELLQQTMKELPQETVNQPAEKALEAKELPQQTVKPPSEKALEAKELPQQTVKPPAEKASKAKELPQKTVKLPSEKASEAKELPQQTVKPPSEKTSKAKELPQQTVKLPSEKASKAKELPQQTVKELHQQTVKPPSEKASKAKELSQQTVKLPSEKALEAKELSQQTVKLPSEKALVAKELFQQTVKLPAEKALEAKELPQQTVKPPSEKALEAKELPQQTVKPPAEKASKAKELPQKTVKLPSEKALEAKELPQQTVKLPAEKALEAKELPQQTVKPPSEKALEAKELPQETVNQPAEKALEAKELPQQTVKPPSEKVLEAKELPQQTVKPPAEKTLEAKELPQQTVKSPAEKALEAKELPQQTVKPPAEKALEAKELPQPVEKLPCAKRASEAKEVPQRPDELPARDEQQLQETGNGWTVDKVFLSLDSKESFVKIREELIPNENDRNFFGGFLRDSYEQVPEKEESDLSVPSVEQEISITPATEEERCPSTLKKEVLDMAVNGIPVPCNLQLASCVLTSQPSEVSSELLQSLEKDGNSVTSLSSSVVQTLSHTTTAKGLETRLESQLTWVCDTVHHLDNLNFTNSHLQHYKELVLLTDKQLHLNALASDIYFFVSENGQDLTPQLSQQLLGLLSKLERSFGELAERLAPQTLQEQQAACRQKLEDLSDWLSHAERSVGEHEAVGSKGELATLQQSQNSIKGLQQELQSQAASSADTIKALEEFLEENCAKMNPSEMAVLQERLQLVKEQYQTLQQRTETAQKELESAVSAAVQQETEKVKAAEQLDLNKRKIELLLDWVTSLDPVTHIQEVDLSQPLPSDAAALQLSEQYERLKARREELLSQQQDCILATQAAQAFLDREGLGLVPDERQQLQNKVLELKKHYAASLLQSEAQLTWVQSLRDELQKFLHDYGDFEVWLQQSEKKLGDLLQEDGRPEALQPLLCRQASFSEDVISHKGDLRYITKSAQKVVDMEERAKEEEQPAFQSSAAVRLVKDKLEEAARRYTALHSECSKLGSYLQTLLHRYEQFQDGACALQTRLQETGEALEKLLSEAVGSEATVLQKQLMCAKNLQGDLTDDQIKVEKVQKMAQVLLETEGDPVLDGKVIQEATDSILSQFQNLSSQLSEHLHLLEKSVTESQSVQETLEDFLQWIVGTEKNLEEHKLDCVSSTCIQASFAGNRKLKQDIVSRKSSLDATREMVNKFLETADGAAADVPQMKLAELTVRFCKVCERQQEQEAALKELLPKAEQYERLLESLQEFMNSKMPLLASGSQPDQDIVQVSQQIKTLNAEMAEQEKAMTVLEKLVTEFRCCPLQIGSLQHLEKVQSLKNDFLRFQEAARKREAEISSCQEGLTDFRKLVGLMRKWLKEKEGSVPSMDACLRIQELTTRMQCLKALLEEWEGKGAQVELITHTGTELENLIMEVTAVDAQSMTGSSASSVNGYHACKDLTEIQCDVSDVRQRYEDLGKVLQDRKEQMSILLERMQEVQQETAVLLKWLESKEEALSVLDVTPIRAEAVRTQAEKNKAFLGELKETSETVHKIKDALVNLIQNHPNSPEVEKWKEMLQDLDQRWDRANQATAERQQRLEESANQLEIFQTAEAQLRPWLMEKELMMSVLGPLSIDPNMLNAQKQQVQFMLKEFETRKQQHEQLIQAAQGILASPGNIPLSSGHVEEKLRGVREKWEELTTKLDSRSIHIDQAIIKSLKYQQVLQDLSEKIKATGQKLGGQSAISTQPEAVKQQLQETSEIRSDLEELEQAVTEAQVLCDDLANLIGEQYLKDELKKRLETVALPLKGLKDLAGDHMHRLQTALASSQQFQQMFDELRTWLNNKRSQQAQSCPVSAKLERLQSQIQKQEEFQKNLNQHSGSYEMIVAEGESLLLCVQPGEERSTLQNQLLTLRAHWEELVKQATDRHSRLKDCLQKAQKYKQHVEDLLPWVENCKVRVAELKVSFDPVQLEAAFLKAKALQNDVEKRGFLVEKMNSAADTLAEVSETDDCEIREEKARLNQDVDAIVKELHIKVGSIEELSQKLKEFRESLQNIEKKLEGTQHQLEIFEALGSQACSNKNLEKMRAQQEVLSELEPQIVYIKDLIHGLVEDAPDGSDSSQLLNQAEAAQREYGLLKQRVNEVCSVMETKLHGISHFHNHVREIFSQLVDLDDELDSMSAIGRDPDSLHSQIEDIQHFMVKLQKLTSDSKSSEAECRHFLEKEGSLDLLGLKRELETLNKQCSKLTERGRNRQEMLEINLARVKDFYSKLKELKQLLTSLGEAKQLRGLVGTEVDAVNQQLIDFKVFQKEQVEPLQLKLQHVSGLGQGLIQSAEKNCDVHGLEHETEELNTWWNTLNKKVAERVAQLQEALLHCGKFQDALEPLLSWLTDTEELIASQKPPSAEYKVVKAQIQEQKLLQRLLDDRKPTVEMIQTEGKRIAESAEPTDKEKILGQLENLGKRWKGLLNKAAARQKQLEDILVLAKEFHETTEPISEWLTSTEKKLANSEPIGTQTVKIQQQIVHHKALQEDILSHAAGVEQMVRIGQKLTSLVDRSMLTEKLDSVQAWYSEMQDRCCRKAVLLELALSNARLFGEEEMELLNWLAELEDKLRFVSVKDYNREVLQRELADQLALNEEIVDRKKNVEQAIRNGQALLKQTTGEEVLLIQEKLDGIKTRYSEITSISLKALRMLEQAQQLATKFQSAHEELLTWLDKVEEELTSSGRQSPTGEEMAKFQQRQKELKKEVMEYRLVLDTVNEVSSALLALVPWRAREGLDKLVLDANERYRLARDTIEHRVHQIDAAIQRSQQYEQTTEAELAWVAETKRKLLALGPIRLEQDKTTAQLQVQKAFSIDIIRHKDCIDELHEIQEEILGTCGQEQKAILQDKVASLAQQYHAVSQLNSERYTQLERAQVLVNQFWETHEELRPWIEETQVAVAQLPPPGVDDELLKQQQEELRQLRESIAEHKPHIDKLMKIGPQLQDLNPEEGEIVQEKYGIAMSKYSQIKAEVHQRAVVLDEAITQAAQNIEFHDKIEPMLETLETLASRLHMPLLIPAEVDKIKESIGENKNALLELEKLLPSFEALKRRGVELIGRSEGADKDPAAKAIQDKLDQMVYFWEDIRAQVNEREMKLLDVLELAEKFWCDLAALLTTIRDTQDIVHDLESPGIDPSIIKQQIEAAETIKEEADGLHEELEYIRILGTDLIFACGEMEKPEVKKSLDEMNNAWENLSKTWTERLEKLEEAMLSSVQYQDTLQAMFDWLDNAVIKLCDMPAVGTDLNTVKEQLNEMKEFKMEVYQQQIEMEKLYHQGELMLKKAIDETDRELIQEPLTELKHLWENLGEKILYRQHRLEAALLALGQFQHALAEVLTWLTHTEELLDAQKPISGDPKILEVELAKHHVLKNDVLAHQTTVETVNRAGNELLESSAADDANSLRTRLQHLNQSWESVCRKTDDREQQLELALQQAQGFHGEIEDFLQWLSKVENQLSLPKATGGLPETAREQLLTHMELYAAFKANEERYKQLNDKGQLMLLSRTESESNSNAEKNVALLEQKWHVVSAKMEERKLKLEEALNLAIEFQNSMQEFINWLTQAEQSLNVVPPPSLILDTVLFQIDEHKVFVNEVNSHRDQIIELDKMGNQLKFLSQKQDVVLIKNLLVSMQSRWEKVVQRSVDRGRALDDAKKRAKQFHEAWKKLIDWLEDAENHLDSELDISNDPDKIKRQLSKHKEFQKTLGSRQPVYDTTVRTGRSLKEKALLADDSQKLDNLLGEVRDKWDTVCGKSVERQHKLEEALLFSGQFMDALQALVDWLYKVEPQLAEEQPVHGDLDLVMNLMDIHKVFQKELGKRTSSVQALKRSARELIENSRDDTTWVKVQLQELSTRWDTVCKLSVSKQTRLEQALKKAEEFRSAVHALLEWLSEAEQTLRFRGALPEDATALQSLIDTHKDFMKNVEDKRADVNTAIEMGESILAVSHPDSVTSIKHWITIIRARFEEVLTWAKQHQQRLESALTELLANSELLEELLTWIQWAETTLMQQDQEPIPQNIDQVKVMISEHQSFMEEMTRKQPDVDKITKTHKRRTTDPNHAPFIEKSRSSRKSINQASPLPPLSHLSQAETKNPRINQLSARWQQVWLLALERQRKLNDALDRLEELKEFANFDFDIWRKKYMRWMNHKKSRVMDFFRRIDKDQDGKITRQEFIDGILASKFPTTRLEMSAVADIFDRDADGYIDYYEFVAVLHPNKDAYRPTTDADKIEDEVTRQVAQCKCAKRFQVEQIGENKYRFFLGNQFGDSQQLRLVRILRSTVMVRVGGGWMALDEFLVKNDPCRARGRTNLELREKFILPEGVSQGMAPFRSRGRRSKPSSRTASPTRSSSSASQSNHSCTSLPSSPATPASGTKTPQHPSRSYDKPWLVNSKAGTPLRDLDYSHLQMASGEVTPSQGNKVKRPHSGRTPLTGDVLNSSCQVSSSAKSSRADGKKNASRPTSRTGSHAGSRASSRRGSDASDLDLLETQSACSDTSESSATGYQGRSPRATSKPSKIPTMPKKCTTATPAKTPGSKR
uniref:Microtubule-actin cross-linking factor 1 isoform X12 n=1 Tax=Geotrypetes seraphini TaxID=260995 RepID=A0A6P8RY03_GEOSA|nr:microtubule-actin cross-linking factor 1 isoform X12 [Geotrypetes seraphini]